jgi:hypothetical protein
MIAILLIAMAAGSASALMFASIVSGALISLLLFYLAPLPLMVAALGWGPLSAGIGGIAAASGLGAILGLSYCIAFAVMAALPAWWLGHLALLGRPIDNGAPSANGTSRVAPDLEWYPVGRVLLWISGFAVLTTMAALLTLGTDAATVARTLREGLLRVAGERHTVPNGDFEHLIDALVVIAPVAGVMVTMTTLTLNLWLAATITATSARLHRPWPDLKSMALPPMTLAALCVAIAFSFTGGMLAILAQIIAVALMMAYALIGFAALHTLTLALKSRAFWLGFTYVVVVMFIWPVTAVMVLGVADAIFGFRQRFWQRRPPPLPAS